MLNSRRSLKSKVLIISLFLIMAARETYAVPSYGTEMPEKRKGFVGYQSNVIFKRDMSDSYGNIKSVQDFLDISYGIFDWLSIEGKIGVGDISRKGGEHPKVDYNYGFAGGYGFRIKVFDDTRNKVKIVTGFHHISVHPPSRNLNGDKQEAILDDWQCELVTSKDIGRFTPYVGGEAVLKDLISRVNEIDRKVRPPLYYGGVIAGCAVHMTKELSVVVESHFIDETSLSTGIYCKF